MEMWMIGFLCGILIVILGATVIYVTSKNKTKIKDTYDERQQRARAEAGKFGFIVALLGFLLLFIIELIATEKKLNINLLFPISIIAFVSLGVFGCVCIWKDAWLMIYQNPKKTLISSLLICIANYLLGFLNYYNYCFSYEHGSVINKETLRNIICGIPFETNVPEVSAINIYMPFINIFCATVMLVLIINYLIKLAVDKSKEKREVNEES